MLGFLKSPARTCTEGSRSFFGFWVHAGVWMKLPHLYAGMADTIRKTRDFIAMHGEALPKFCETNTEYYFHLPWGRHHHHQHHHHHHHHHQYHYHCSHDTIIVFVAMTLPLLLMLLLLLLSGTIVVLFF